MGVMSMKGYSAFPNALTRWWGSYPTAEMQLVYSTAPAERAKIKILC